ncbi:hypothetical protein SAMN04488005_1412 [Yoonia tamlensis]|uniref:Uncharacterized protein n=1 Tax=Yoonia tamlensis TaxID=390270 RepID=A0A1I6GCJ7_9RHOB|nr:hypothetical protein [Yoonia tamlensis]SFR39797.1 hypothetical protein SAMN04488005_1412 [Yoonia tamlensis]
MASSTTAAQVVNFDSPARAPKPKTLVIGDVMRWQAQGRNIAPFDGLEFHAFDALGVELLAETAPETIFSPLIADTFDAYDLAQFLGDCGFSGRYCAISNPLPDRDAVIAEVKRRAPALWFDIFIVPA